MWHQLHSFWNEEKCSGLKAFGWKRVNIPLLSESTKANPGVLKRNAGLYRISFYAKTCELLYEYPNQPRHKMPILVLKSWFYATWNPTGIPPYNIGHVDEALLRCVWLCNKFNRLNVTIWNYDFIPKNCIGYLWGQLREYDGGRRTGIMVHPYDFSVSIWFLD